MRKKIKIVAWITAMFIAISPFMGCGILNPPSRDGDGYYSQHFRCCGSIAIEKAFIEYKKRREIVDTRYVSAKEISKQIQDDGLLLKGFLSLFDKRAVCATWSWEIKNLVKKYGFKLVSISDFTELDPLKDIAFVLVHGKFFSGEWHWLCFPVDKNIINYFGSNTKIDKIYLLKKDENSGVLHLGSK